MSKFTLVKQTVDPSAPAAGRLTVYHKGNSLWIIDEYGNKTDIGVQQDVLIPIKKASAGTLVPGTPVYIIGCDGTYALVEAAKADLVTTMPAFAIVESTATDVASGRAAIAGCVGMDTTAWASGDELYVSDSVAGAMVNTPPVGPNIVQKVADVVKISAAGVIEAVPRAPERLSNTTPQAVGNVAAGTTTEASRSDHVHAHGNQVGGTLHADVVAAGASGFMSGSDKTRLDNIETGAQVDDKNFKVTGADTTDGFLDDKLVTTASLQKTVLNPGADEDLRLDVQFGSGSPANVDKSTAAQGSSTDVARRDHKHDVTTAAPATGIGGANSEGTSSSVARADHNHALRTGTTDLTLGTVNDGEYLYRSGTTIASAPPPVFGQGYEKGYLAGPINTTGTTWVTGYAFTTSANLVQGAVYRVGFRASLSSADKEVYARLEDTTGGGTVIFNPVTARPNVAAQQAHPSGFATFTRTAAAGLHTITLQFSGEVGASVNIAEMHIEIWRIS